MYPGGRGEGVQVGSRSNICHYDVYIYASLSGKGLGIVMLLLLPHEILYSCIKNLPRSLWNCVLQTYLVPCMIVPICL